MIDKSDTAISISSEEELNIFSGIVNGTYTLDGIELQSNFSEYIIILLNNIALQDVVQEESNFTPIGDSSNQFKGIFDGQGHTISNLQVSDVQFAGLFGYIGKDAIVKNLGIIDSSISANSTTAPVCSGGITAYNNGTILNCYNFGAISGISDNLQIYLGGISGSNFGEILNCYNAGSITSKSTKEIYSGGIVGLNNGTVTQSYNVNDLTTENSSNELNFGGVIGYNASQGKITGCYNVGDISITHSSDNTYLGGVIGNNYGGIISNCYNIGAMSFSGLNVYSGGIVGSNLQNGTIINCYNLGNMNIISASGTTHSGGIAGGNDNGTISYCYNTGNLAVNSSTAYSGGVVGNNNHGTILNCCNTGSVNTNSSTYAYSGGIAGWNHEGNASITHCYNLGYIHAVNSTDSTACSGGIIGINNGKISNCYNVGLVTGGSGTTGGIVGQNDSTADNSDQNSFYLKECAVTDASGATELSSDAMKGLSLLGSTENNLNKDQNPKSWSPDIFGINDGYPILADVPLSILLGHSAPKSAVYIVADDNEPQTENYLELESIISGGEFKVKNVKLGSDLKVSETLSISWSKLTYDSVNKKFIWENDSNTSTDGAISPADGKIYQAVVTFNVGDGSGTPYRYTSLSRTAEVKYSVIYNPNGGTGSMIDSKSPYSSGDKVTVLNNAFIAPEGKVFAGWSTESGGTVDEKYTPGKTISIVNNNITLYAVWKDLEYSVYYYSLTGDKTADVDTTKYAKDSPVTAEEAPIKSGYEFKGWLMYEYGKTESTEVPAGTTFTMPSSDVIMIADWEKISSGSSGGSTSYVKQYSVIYVSDADTANVPCDSKLYTSGSSASILENKLSKAGCISDGWNTKADGSGTHYDKGDTVKISSSNIILYAQFKQDSSAPIGPNSPNAVSVTFCIDNKVYETVYVNKGSCLDSKMPENPEKQNDKFKGWFYLDSENNKIEFTAESTVNSNMTVFAEFESSQASNASSSSTTIIIIIAVIIALIAAALIAYFFYFRKQ